MAENRLLCEGWIEKQIFSLDPNLSQKGKKWKTRYALLVLKHSSFIELRFYHKKPKTFTDITDEIITLSPWRYTADILNEGKDRPHIIRVQVYNHGFVTPPSTIVRMSMQYGEEALAWIRCIQNLTKLTSGIQGHTFGVVISSTPSSQSIGLSDRHCLLHIATEAVTLALKSDRSVLSVWPLPSIRSYTTTDPSHFSITSGCRSPLGEGVYKFQTMEGDGDALFNLMDHYTGVTSSVTMLSSSKSLGSYDKKQTKLRHRRSFPQPVSSRQSVRSQHEIRARLPSSPAPQKPPRKPPLPKNRSITSPVNNNSFNFTPTGSNTNQPSPDDTCVSVKESNPQKSEEMDERKSQSYNTTVSRGLYDLDKLLYTLEGNIRKDKNVGVDEVEAACRDLLVDVIEEIANNEHKTCPAAHGRINTDASCQNETSIEQRPNEQNIKPALYQPLNSTNGNVLPRKPIKPAIISPKPNLQGRNASGKVASYSSVNWSRKSVKQEK